MAARCAFAAGSAGVVFLCVAGLKPAAVAIPVFLAVISLLLAAGSAALFARVTGLQFEESGRDAEDEGGGGWDGPGPARQPPDGGDLEFDWQRFEREFRSYCERVPSAALS